MDNVIMTPSAPSSAYGTSVCGNGEGTRPSSELAGLRPRTHAVQLDPEPSAPRRWDP